MPLEVGADITWCLSSQHVTVTTSETWYRFSRSFWAVVPLGAEHAVRFAFPLRELVVFASGARLLLRIAGVLRAVVTRGARVARRLRFRSATLAKQTSGTVIAICRVVEVLGISVFSRRTVELGGITGTITQGKPFIFRGAVMSPRTPLHRVDCTDCFPFTISAYWTGKARLARLTIFLADPLRLVGVLAGRTGMLSRPHCLWRAVVAHFAGHHCGIGHAMIWARKSLPTVLTTARIVTANIISILSRVVGARLARFRI